MHYGIYSFSMLASRLWLLLAVQTSAVSDSVEKRSLDIRVDASGSNPHLTQAGAQHRQLLRFEKKSKPSSDDATLQRLLEKRRAAREEEAVIEFQRALEGKWMPLTGLDVLQSSVLHSGIATRAIDGQVNSVWTGGSCTHTTYEWKPWWRVQLPMTYHIAAVQVTNRGDCCGEQCNICSPMNVLVDLSECQANVQFTHGETKEIPCPMVGDSIKIQLYDEDYLMLCEVKARGTPQALLENGAAQCERHSVVVQAVVTPNATDGRCVTQDSVLSNVSDALESLYAPRHANASAVADELHGTSKECEEHILNSNELVEGAVWQALPHSGSETSHTIGVCKPIKGRRIVGAERAEGAMCFRKLQCPQNMAYWRQRAGIKHK